MKFLAAILVFMIAAQPVKAAVCDMHPSGEGMTHSGMSDQGAGQDTGHGAGHQDGGTASHDCCSTGQGGDSERHSDCANSVFCGSCVAGLSAVAPLPEAAGFLNASYRPVTVEGLLASRHPSPPLRPPIQNS